MNKLKNKFCPLCNKRLFVKYDDNISKEYFCSTKNINNNAHYTYNNVYMVNYAVEYLVLDKYYIESYSHRETYLIHYSNILYRTPLKINKFTFKDLEDLEKRIELFIKFS